MVLNKIRDLIGKSSSGEEYVEIDLSQDDKRSKVLIKPFILKKFEDTNEILNSLREGYTIAIMDIQHLRKKDVIELKRSISKIKKTTEALGGSIIGFGENLVIATPSFAEILPPIVESPPEKKGFDMH